MNRTSNVQGSILSSFHFFVQSLILSKVTRRDVVRYGLCILLSIRVESSISLYILCGRCICFLRDLLLVFSILCSLRSTEAPVYLTIFSQLFYRRHYSYYGTYFLYRIQIVSHRSHCDILGLQYFIRYEHEYPPHLCDTWGPPPITPCAQWREVEDGATGNNF